ncbi:MAG: RIP metalloprotease RseP [Niabella sp.]|nr:RIP metalloprotease RseP [Niabella sp.]
MVLLAFNWSAFGANVGQFILSFSILIALHEFGHFITAKWFGCRVEKFYLFFNPWFSLWKKKIGETEYGIGWVPLGGYVKISGMIDESMDKEAMKQPAQPWEFRSKPAWQRLIIMLAGVIINFVLALIIFSMILFKWGEEKLPVANMKYGITADSMALKVGLKDGDLITKVNDKELKYFDDLPKALLLSEKNTLTVNRNGQDTLISFPPGFLSELTKNQLKNFVSVRFPNVVDSVDRSKAKFTSGELLKGDKIVGIDGKPVEYFSDFAKQLRNYKGKTVTLAVIRNNADSVKVGATIDDAGKLGYYPKPGIDFISFETRKYGFFESIPAGIRYGVNRLVEYVENLKLLFTSKEHKVSDNLGSVISIGKTFGGTWDWERFWTMTGLFSIILAFMNVLPIPALDGGHALFTLYEMITGRKPGDKFMEYAQMVGMVLLLGLMAYALGLDIFRLFR